MSKDRAIGGLIFAVCLIFALAYVVLLFFYDPYIVSFLNIRAASDIQFWLIATPVGIALVAILGIGAWIGWTMATTPPPKPIEELATEDEETPT
jgi:predicted DNA-binding transcriptional regulator